MILDQIILRLTEPLASRADAMVLGRMGFLEWLISVPIDGSFALQATHAYERAAPLKTVVPAVGVLCELLQQAASESNARAEIPSARSARRKKSLRRRSLQ